MLDRTMLEHMHQAWEQLDYDPVQGRPSFIELIMQELNLNRQEALQVLEEMSKYPR